MRSREPEPAKKAPGLVDSLAGCCLRRPADLEEAAGGRPRPASSASESADFDEQLALQQHLNHSRQPNHAAEPGALDKAMSSV